MRSPQNSKVVKILAPISVSNATATVTEVDTAGFATMRVIVGIGVTTAALTALKLQAGDTSGSGWADVTGLNFSAALPSATDDGLHWVFDVSLPGRGRYWNLVLTTDAQSGIYCAYAILSEATQAPNTDTERGNATGGYLAA